MAVQNWDETKDILASPVATCVLHSKCLTIQARRKARKAQKVPPLYIVVDEFGTGTHNSVHTTNLPPTPRKKKNSIYADLIRTAMSLTDGKECSSANNLPTAFVNSENLPHSKSLVLLL